MQRASCLNSDITGLHHELHRPNEHGQQHQHLRHERLDVDSKRGNAPSPRRHATTRGDISKNDKPGPSSPGTTAPSLGSSTHGAHSVLRSGNSSPHWLEPPSIAPSTSPSNSRLHSSDRCCRMVNIPSFSSTIHSRSTSRSRPSSSDQLAFICHSG